nr:hypothetical protein Iba_chr15fCG5960 [Ipomoea batatas]
MESLRSGLFTGVCLLRMVFRHLLRAWIAAGTFSVYLWRSIPTIQCLDAERSLMENLENMSG